MTSPDLIHELQASKPVAPDALRMRVREIAPTQAVQLRRRLRFSLPRPAFVLVPAAAALVVAVGAAGVIGLARSGGSGDVAAQNAKAVQHGVAGGSTRTNPAVLGPATTTQEQAASPPQALGYTGAGAAVAPTQGRAQDVQATLTVKVADSDHVSKAAQDALDVTRSLGGHVVSASVATGDQAQATLTVRIPVARTEDAVARLATEGLLDDAEFAAYWVEQRLVFRPRGPRALSFELRTKGVSRDAMEPAIEVAKADQGEAACRAGLREARRHRGASDFEFSAVITRYLTRRGFDFAVTHAAVRDLRTALDAEDATT